RLPISPLFPYTTLFRSRALEQLARVALLAALLERARAHVVDPGQAVGDVAVVGPDRERARDVLLGLLEVGAALRPGVADVVERRSEEHTSELQSLTNLV